MENIFAGMAEEKSLNLRLSPQKSPRLKNKQKTKQQQQK